MKRPLLILFLLLMLGLLGYYELNKKIDLAPNMPKPLFVMNSEQHSDAALKPTEEAAALLKTPEKLVSEKDDPTGTRRRRAFILSLDKGALTLLEQQDIEGDFAPKRRKPEEWSGMLRCRLMSENNEVLAEELLPAPDHLCAVIDPKSGSDKPVPFTLAGPVTFQVRLPRVKEAIRLDISRIIQPADSTQPGLEGQLGSIPLPRS